MRRKTKTLMELQTNFCHMAYCTINIYKEGKFDAHFVYRYMDDIFNKLEATVNGLLYFGAIETDQAEDLLGYCNSYQQGILHDAGLL